MQTTTNRKSIKLQHTIQRKLYFWNLSPKKLHNSTENPLLIRDVNSWEIAFPERESQFPGLDRDSRFRPSTYFHLRDGSLAGARRGGAITGRTRRHSRPTMGPQRRLWMINIAGGGYRGSATGEAQRPSAPGRQAGESPPPPVGRR